MADGTCDVMSCSAPPTHKIVSPSLTNPGRREYSLVCEGHITKQLELRDTYADMLDSVVTRIS